MSCPIGTDIAHAAALLRAGRLVAFATETVYGLGADALNAEAVAGVFQAKERPHFDPLIVHVLNPDDLAPLVGSLPPTARTLAEKFWPGPLTLVLPKTDRVPDLVTAGMPTVAVRIPAHPIARQLLEAAGCPVAAPSANRFGQVSPTTAQHVAEQLADRIDYVLDGGPATVGVESTVLQLHADDSGHNRATLLRPGGLPLEDLEAVIGPIDLPTPGEHPSAAAQPAPGMLPRHYAPRTPLIIAGPTAPLPDGKQVALLTFTTPPDSLRQKCAALEVLSPAGDLREAAAAFFAALRRLDRPDIDLIVAHPFPETGLGRALNDRLHRAAEK